MILVVQFSRIKSAAKLLGKEFSWTYLGKDADKRAKSAIVLRNGTRYYLINKLHAAAATHRTAYLDYMAALASRQDNPLNWWASTFASKSPYQTDFYLLFCYLIIIDDMIVDNSYDSRDLCVVVEDPWVYEEIRQANRYKEESVLFIGRPSELVLRKLRTLTWGIGLRFAQALSFILKKILLIASFVRPPTTVTEKLKPTVGIMSYAEARSFNINGYSDPYTGDLSKLLIERGYNVVRPVHVHYPVSLTRKICSASDFMWSLINEIRFIDFAALFKVWMPTIPDEFNTLSGYSIKMLLQRERWAEFGKVGFNRYLMMGQMLGRFYNRNWCRLLIYPYENQPWEKILCIVSQKHGIPTIGYQHSTIPRYLLMMFLGKGEFGNVPLPDKIIVNGEYHLKLMHDCGYPSTMLALGGAWRYLYTINSVNHQIHMNRFLHNDEMQVVSIYVFLPLNKHLAEYIMGSVIDVFANDVIINRLPLKLCIKPHPNLPLGELDIDLGRLINYEVVTGSLREIMQDVDIAVYQGTTTGVEALLHGKVVIRLIMENFIDMDPLAGIDHPCLINCYENELCMKINEAIGMASSSEHVAYDMPVRFFSDIIPDAWINSIEELNGG